ncbi:sigma-70 family RNA polymerase sigma factor [Opitutus sp. ER46]|uniref:RNA polymerase sigma factor n=1 Tax=Opitutus sp. ER46 TaxID=2161864 RepID=UPI0011B24D3E|nr:sigma-70 family RNA polymerase sigma factor [Opitutus sp. ER46]
MRSTSLSTYQRPATDPHSPELMDLVDRARIGDLDAQSELVRRYTPRISGFVRPIVGQPSAVEDVVQMVFIKMVRRFKLLRNSAAFESWLFRLARNTALDSIRRRRCRPVTVDDEIELERAADTSSERVIGEIQEAFELAVRRLNPIDRELVRMIVEGHSYSIAAERSGLTVGAVKVRLCRVRPFLRCSVGGETGARLPETAVYAPPRRRAAA